MMNLDVKQHFQSSKRTPDQYYAINNAIKKFPGGSDMDYARLEKAGLSLKEIRKFNMLWKNYSMKGA